MIITNTDLVEVFANGAVAKLWHVDKNERWKITKLGILFSSKKMVKT